VIRPATAADAARIAEIYRPYVTETAISFEETPPDAAEILSRMEASHLWLVDDTGEEIRGYAYATRWRSRHAYRFTAETTVYVASEHHGRGVGRTLYEELLGQLTGLGFVTVVAGITLPNDRSVEFHRSLGFTDVGRFPEVGFKFDTWYDTGWMVRSLRDPQRDDPPRTP
jgi:phosphinothricin acetyltransferase